MASKKDMTIKIGADQVLYTNISKSKDGYNSARVVAKVSEKEYMSVSYEWEGDAIPDFAMNLMSFMQANEMEIGLDKELASEYEEFAAKSKKPPFWKKDDEKDGDDKKDEKKKDKKKDKKKKEKSGDGSQVHCKNCKKTKDKCDCGDWQPVPYKTKDQKENTTK